MKNWKINDQNGNKKKPLDKMHPNFRSFLQVLKGASYARQIPVRVLAW